ncbi:MAG: class I SAM-dependent methyltransferase [Bryobacteraceae bacterium]
MKSWLKNLFGGSAPEAPTPLGEIRRSFDQASSDEEHFPSTIDPRIYHVQLLLNYFGPQAAGRVLDNGCGKGRFARVLYEHHPQASIVAFDLSEAMLHYVPKGIQPCSGTMTHLPFASASFDCVYATESLEHAVEIDIAVGEMCRVLKPGGRLVIIDKNAEHWGRFKTPQWERWFRREELEKLLRRDCQTVSSRFISYWDDVEPDGLFVAWLAQK